MKKPNYTAPDSAYVQVRKVLPYTITPIQDLKAWKADIEAKSEVHAQAIAKRVENVKEAFISGGLDLQAAEAEVKRLQGEQALYKRMQKSYKNATEHPSTLDENRDFIPLEQRVYVDEDVPTPTFAERLTAAAKRLWNNAFPE